MLTQITSRMPRILYFSLRRFWSLITWIAGGFAIGFAAIQLLDFSQYMFGTALPMLVVLILGLLGLLSYMAAQFDVAGEQREQEKVLNELRKD